LGKVNITQIKKATFTYTTFILWSEAMRITKQKGFSGDAARLLFHNGAVVIDDFFSASDSESLSYELSCAFELAEKAGTKRSIGNGFYGLWPRELAEERKNELPLLYDFLHDKDLQSIGGSYLGLNKSDYLKINNHLECEVNMALGRSNASLPHFDRMPGLKMILYLTDVDEKNGPTFFYPNTFRSVRNQLLSTLNNVGDVHDLANFILPDDVSSERVAVHCRKGSLVIVDTCTLHGGGHLIGEHAVRKCVRGTTWYLPSSHSRLSPQAIPVDTALFENDGDVENVDWDKFVSFSDIPNELKPYQIDDQKTELGKPRGKFLSLVRSFLKR
jgi:hypothetical protein